MLTLTIQRMSGRTASAVRVAVVFAVHCILGFILYGGTVISHWAIGDSEFIVFFLPLLLAVSGYAFALFPSPWLTPRSALKGIALLLLCLILVFLSTSCYMFFALNRYGS